MAEVFVIGRGEVGICHGIGLSDSGSIVGLISLTHIEKREVGETFKDSLKADSVRIYFENIEGLQVLQDAIDEVKRALEYKLERGTR